MPFSFPGFDIHAPKTSSHPLGHKVIWGAGIASLALTLSPYLLPMVGIGSENLRYETDSLLHSHTNPYGTGLAGGINTIIGSLPLVGGLLTSSLAASLIASTVIGIGGVIAAKWLETKETGAIGIKWSKIIRTSALLTSALISLPSLLTGITTGLSFIELAFGDKGEAVSAYYNSIGIAGGHSGTVGILGAAIPHLLLCGASILPLGLAHWIGSKYELSHTHDKKPSTILLAHNNLERSSDRLIPNMPQVRI